MDNPTMLLLMGAMAVMSRRRGGSAVHGDIAVLASQFEALRERERKQAAERARMLGIAMGLLSGSVTEEQAVQQMSGPSWPVNLKES